MEIKVVTSYLAVINDVPLSLTKSLKAFILKVSCLKQIVCGASAMVLNCCSCTPARRPATWCSVTVEIALHIHNTTRHDSLTCVGKHAEASLLYSTETK